MNKCITLIFFVMFLMSVLGGEQMKVVDSVNGAIYKDSFGKMPDGKEVDLYTLENKKGIKMQVTNYGMIVTSLKVPDRDHRINDIVLGYDNLDDYIKDNPYFGCVVGRYGNRIAKGTFYLEGKRYRLAVNNGPNHLHGGLKGFDQVLWMVLPVESKSGISLQGKYISRDKEEGYPGNLKVTVTYTLTPNNEFRIEYYASTDKTTIINLTHHSYFNLKGHNKGDILRHQLKINADFYTPVDSTLIPTGEISPVKGTAMDFILPKAIGADINKNHPQLKYGKGYDFNWVLNNWNGKLQLAAKVYESNSGRIMEVYTNQPGIQFYSGNFLDGSQVGKGGAVYNFRQGFCLETQFFPDSPNQSKFPSVTLKPGQEYHHLTVYKFKINQ